MWMFWQLYLTGSHADQCLVQNNVKGCLKSEFVLNEIALCHIVIVGSRIRDVSHPSRAINPHKPLQVFGALEDQCLLWTDDSGGCSELKCLVMLNENVLRRKRQILPARCITVSHELL